MIGQGTWGGLGAGLALGLASAASAQHVPWYPGEEVKISAGLEAVRDWSRSHLTTNLMKQGRAWGSPTDPWEGQANIVLDANGWPTQDAGVILVCCQPNNQGLEGVYQISFECSTLPEIRLIATLGTIQNVSRDPNTGIVTAEYVWPQNWEQLMLGFFGTDPDGPGGLPGGIRNLKVIRPGADESDPWDPLFREHVSRFDMLRFMDTNIINGSTISQWSERTQQNDPSWRIKTGVPYEDAIQLCNDVDADYYVCLPHRADDEYVRQLARLVRDNLEPGLNVYVEYSNEVWNLIYRQGRDVRDWAVAEVGAGPTLLTDQNATDSTTWRWRWYARRTMEIANIFSQEFGPGALNSRVRVVLAGQAARDEQYLNMLRWIERNYGNPQQYFWALGIAPYNYAWHVDNWENVTVDDYLNELRASNVANGSIAYYDNSLLMERYAAYSAWYGLAPFVSYEAGPDTRGSRYTTIKQQVHGDPRMRALCNDYVDMLHAKGGGSVVWAIAGAGSWLGENGAYHLTESMLDQNTPKILALDDSKVRPRAAINGGQPVPGTLDGRRHVQRNEQTWQSGVASPTILQGDFIEYLIRSDEQVTMPVSVEATMWEDAGSITLAVNGTTFGDVQLARTTSEVGGNEFRTFGRASVTFPRGYSTLRIISNRPEGFRIRSIFAGCDDIDFNNDGVEFDPQDIDAFLSVFSEGPCVPETATCNDIDFNNDGSVFDPADIDSFLSVFSEGPCL